MWQTPPTFQALCCVLRCPFVSALSIIVFFSCISHETLVHLLCHFCSFHFSKSFQICWLGPFDGSLLTILSVRCSNVLKHKLCFVYFFGLLLMFLIQPLIPKFVSCNCVCVYMYDCVCVSTCERWVPVSYALRFLTYPRILWHLHLNMSLGERNPAFPIWCHYQSVPLWCAWGGCTVTFRSRTAFQTWMQAPR